MFRFFGYHYEDYSSSSSSMLKLNYLMLFLLILFLNSSRPCSPARLITPSGSDQTSSVLITNTNADDDHKRNATWHDFAKFLDAVKGSHVSGMSNLKEYFRRFGYLSFSAVNLTDTFDDQFESALLLYQTNLGLPVTGNLDSDTITAMMSPRCGVTDDHAAKATDDHWRFHDTRHYAYFYGRPRWQRSAPMTLSYAFSPNIINVVKYLRLTDIRSVFRRSFSRWSAVIPVNFKEADDYSSADIKIGFFKGDHGDGEPFDGVLGVLAHAFSPENGRFHLDAAESWAVDFEKEKSKAAVDLESVVTHEIGHVLGLGHTSVKEAVMYPSLSPRTKKVDLKLDDVRGVQALYGSNPNFKMSSLLDQSENNSQDSNYNQNQSFSPNTKCPFCIWILLSLSFFIFIYIHRH